MTSADRRAGALFDVTNYQKDALNLGTQLDRDMADVSVYLQFYSWRVIGFGSEMGNVFRVKEKEISSNFSQFSLVQNCLNGLSAHVELSTQTGMEQQQDHRNTWWCTAVPQPACAACVPALPQGPPTADSRPPAQHGDREGQRGGECIPGDRCVKQNRL